MKKRVVTALLVLSVLPYASACGKAEQPSNFIEAPADIVITSPNGSTGTASEETKEKTRVEKKTKPGTFSGIDAETAYQNRVFEISLFDSMLAGQDSNSNIICSPLGYRSLLTMAYTGMKKDASVYTNLSDILGYQGGTASKKSAEYSKFIDEMQALKQQDGIKWLNSVWADDQAELKENSSWGDEKKHDFDAKINQSDLQSEGFVAAFNAYVNESTEGLIPSLLSQPLPDDALMVLANVLYMNAEWRVSFKEENTFSGDFMKADGSVIKTDLMQHETNVPYYTDGTLEAVSLAYKDSPIRMNIIKRVHEKQIPNSVVENSTAGNDTTETESNLVQKIAKKIKTTAAEKADLKEIWRDMSEEEKLQFISLSEDQDAEKVRDIELRIPKMDIKTDTDFTGAAERMGLADIFNENVFDDSMMPAGQLSAVLQKARVKMDEKGTEAAAVTVGAEALTVAISDEEYSAPLQFYADHPFIFSITDNYNNVLFMGYIDDPTAE